MASIKLNTTDKTYEVIGNDTLLGNMIDGLRAPFMPSDEVATSKAGKYGVALWCTGSAAATSVVTRQRAAQGKAPIGKIFF